MTAVVRKPPQFRVIDGGRKPIDYLNHEDVFALSQAVVPVDANALMAWIDSALWEAASLLHEPGRRDDARRLIAAALGAMSTLPEEES